MVNLFNYFDSLNFSVKLGVCSGFKCIVSSIDSDEYFKKLTDRMTYWRNQVQVYQHIYDLVKDHGDVDYQHQYDAAITVYLHALSKTNMAVAILAADQVRNGINCWWSSRMVAELKDKT